MLSNLGRNILKKFAYSFFFRQTCGPLWSEIIENLPFVKRYDRTYDQEIPAIATFIYPLSLSWKRMRLI